MRAGSQFALKNSATYRRAAPSLFSFLSLANFACWENHQTRDEPVDVKNVGHTSKWTISGHGREDSHCFVRVRSHGVGQPAQIIHTAPGPFFAIPASVAAYSNPSSSTVYFLPPAGYPPREWLPVYARVADCDMIGMIVRYVGRP
jgi:hypothetical protein